MVTLINLLCKEQEIQMLLLPSFHRQIILLEKISNISNPAKQNSMHVHRHHHPMVLLSKLEDKVMMKFACKGMSATLKTDVFTYVKDTWTSNQSINSLDVERQGEIYCFNININIMVFTSPKHYKDYN